MCTNGTLAVKKREIEGEKDKNNDGDSHATDTNLGISIFLDCGMLPKILEGI